MKIGVPIFKLGREAIASPPGSKEAGRVQLLLAVPSGNRPSAAEFSKRQLCMQRAIGLCEQRAIGLCEQKTTVFCKKRPADYLRWPSRFSLCCCEILLPSAKPKGRFAIHVFALSKSRLLRCKKPRFYSEEFTMFHSFGTCRLGRFLFWGCA